MNIAIIGAGFGGLYTYRKLQRLEKKYKLGTKFFVFDIKNYFLFTPLLHEVAGSNLHASNTSEPVRKFINTKNTDFFVTTDLHISVPNKQIAFDNQTINFDYLVLATGSTTNYYNIPGAKEYTHTLKNIADAFKIKQEIITLFEKNNKEQGKPLAINIVGGGATGVELAAEIAEFVSNALKPHYKNLNKNTTIRLIQKDSRILKSFDSYISEYATNSLSKLGIEILLNSNVSEVTKNSVIIENQIYQSDLTIWVVGVKAQIPNIDIDLEKSLSGRILVDKTLQVRNHKNIFAIGDVASVVSTENNLEYPMLAQVATNQGVLAANNLYKILRGNDRLEEFDTKIKGILLSLGKFNAVGIIGRFKIKGLFAWFIWRTVYLFKFISNSKKIRVALDWTINLFSNRDISKII